MFGQAEGPTTQSTELFSAISALVGFLFAFNAMLLTVPQRRNLINDLRLDGYSPLGDRGGDAVRRGGTRARRLATRAAARRVLSHGLLQANPGYLSFAFPVGSLRIVSWQSVVLATAGGLLASVIGVTVPLRARDLRVASHGRHASPSARRRRESLSSCWPGWSGWRSRARSCILGISSVPMAVVAFVSLVLSLLLILPIAFSGLVALFDMIQRPVMGVSPQNRGHRAAVQLHACAIACDRGDGSDRRVRQRRDRGGTTESSEWARSSLT